MLKRLPQDQLEDDSIAAVASFFNANKWEFNRQTRDKSGIDGEVEIVHGIERSGRFLKCQVKAGRSYISSETDTSIKIKLERRYLEHWAQMSAQVLLLFYHPDTRCIYWKAIKPHLALNPVLLTHSTESCVIGFDKEQELLEKDCLVSLEAVEGGRFSYNNILVEGSRLELGWSNWFPVNKFPTLWQANTDLTTRSLVESHLTCEYSFTIRAGKLITFSNIKNPDCELRKFVHVESIEAIALTDIHDQTLVEILNQTLFILAKRRSLVYRRDRFYFSLDVLKQPETNQFSYISLKGREESRTKIYFQRVGTRTEYKHHAVRLSFIQHLEKWYLQLDPDWHFTYPFGTRMSRAEIGARITSEKASTYNKDYLYLLHFWRQFLSNGENAMGLRCSNPDDTNVIEVSSLPLEFKFHFRLFNDYIGPKIEG